jgi:hypothetical protein
LTSKRLNIVRFVVYFLSKFIPFILLDGSNKLIEADPRSFPKLDEQKSHVMYPNFAIKSTCDLVAADPRGPPYKVFVDVDLILPDFAKAICFSSC